MEADDKRGVLTGDDARDALEDFFTTWLEDWWKHAHGELIMKSLPLIPCGGLPDPSESFYSSSPDRPFIPLGGCKMTEEMMKRGANPFCLYWGLQTIFDEWEKARDELEELFWPQSKSPKVGRTYTRTGKGAEIPPGKPGRPPKKKKKKKKPGRPKKYRSDEARQKARKASRDKWNRKRAKARRFVREQRKKDIARRKKAESIARKERERDRRERQKIREKIQRAGEKKIADRAGKKAEKSVKKTLEPWEKRMQENRKRRERYKQNVK